MKHITRLLIIILILTVTVACGDNNTPTNVPAATSPPVAEATQPPVTVPPTLPPAVVEVEATDGEQPAAPEEAPAEVAPETVPIDLTLAPWPADQFGYGVQIHGDSSYGDAEFATDVVKNRLGLSWIKMQLKWPVVHPEPDADQWFFYDGYLDEAQKQGLYVMVSVVGAPEWTRTIGGENGPPDDYSLYAGFLQEMLERHGDKIHAIEVWNEQNLDREWTTGRPISAAEYVELLRVAHETIKAYDPNIIVITGALAPTGVNDGVTVVDDFVYMDQALAAGMLNYADCVGAHHNGYNIPPDVAFDATGSLAEAGTATFRGPFDNPNHSWSFRTTMDTYAQKVQAVDPTMRLCVTEFGWASSEGYPATPEGFGFANDNTLEEQATFIVQAYNQMRDSGNVWLTYLFNFDFGNKGWGYEDDTVPYSIINRDDGSPRPAFDAVSDMEKTP